MCGIAVFFGSRDDPVYGRRKRMIDCLRHRGPDGVGEHEIQLPNNRVLWMGHSRLSILDLSDSGRQPMTDPVTRNVVVFNGEIYNFRELAENLKTKGVRLHSTGDTEVLLTSYRIWKREAVRLFRGMFAFVLWDAREETLWCARDAFGIKPLYFHENAGSIVIASEMRAIMAVQDGANRIHPDAKYEYFNFGAPHAPSTMLRGIQSFSPGELRGIGIDGKTRARSVEGLPWKGRPQEQIVPTGSYEMKLQNSFAAAVERHMAADVPVGLFLSGGLDSSMLAAVLAEDLGQKPECYTVTFIGDEKPWDESVYARRVAARFGLPHAEIRLSPDDVLRQIEAGLNAMDQPTIDGLNTYVVAGAVHRAGGKVALSGLGSDELFAGYSRLRMLPFLRRLLRLPVSMRRAMAAMIPPSEDPFARNSRLKRLLLFPGSDPIRIYHALREIWPPRELDQLFVRPTHQAGRPEAKEPAEAPPQGLDGVTCLEFEYYLADILLRDADVMGMAHSLEIRVPYLDTDFVRVVRSLPPSVRFGGFPKSVLVEQRLKPLGRDFLYREKRGFMLPFDRWLRGPLRPLAESVLFDEDLHEQLGLRTGVLKSWAAKFFGDHSLPWARLWAVIVYLHWGKRNHATE
jgi:asparagine synthase (glutamine-hydrolysing)